MAVNLSYEEAKVFGLEQSHPDHASQKKKPEKVRVIIPGPKMSKPERLLEAFLLGRKVAGVIADFKFESVNLRLAQKCWYLPDFSIWLPDRSLVFVETKGGYVYDDSVVKYKAAAEHYPNPFFLAAYTHKWKITQLPGPGWREDLQDFFDGI